VNYFALHTSMTVKQYLIPNIDTCLIAIQVQTL
jgi:hypothetical protein